MKQSQMLYVEEIESIKRLCKNCPSHGLIECKNEIERLLLVLATSSISLFFSSLIKFMTCFNSSNKQLFFFAAAAAAAESKRRYNSF